MASNLVIEFEILAATKENCVITFCLTGISLRMIGSHEKKLFQSFFSDCHKEFVDEEKLDHIFQLRVCIRRDEMLVFRKILRTF